MFDDVTVRWRHVPTTLLQHWFALAILNFLTMVTSTINPVWLITEQSNLRLTSPHWLEWVHANRCSFKGSCYLVTSTATMSSRLNIFQRIPSVIMLMFNRLWVHRVTGVAFIPMSHSLCLRTVNWLGSNLSNFCRFIWLKGRFVLGSLMSLKLSHLLAV